MEKREKRVVKEKFVLLLSRALRLPRELFDESVIISRSACIDLCAKFVLRDIQKYIAVDLHLY